MPFAYATALSTDWYARGYDDFRFGNRTGEPSPKLNLSATQQAEWKEGWSMAAEDFREDSSSDRWRSQREMTKRQERVRLPGRFNGMHRARYRHLTPDEIAHIAAMVLAGKTMRAIAKEMGRSTDTICKAYKRWLRRTEQNQPVRQSA